MTSLPTPNNDDNSTIWKYAGSKSEMLPPPSDSSFPSWYTQQVSCNIPNIQSATHPLLLNARTITTEQIQIAVTTYDSQPTSHHFLNPFKTCWNVATNSSQTSTSTIDGKNTHRSYNSQHGETPHRRRSLNLASMTTLAALYLIEKVENNLHLWVIALW